ncbi:hypothetical protein VIGAN_05223000, partial [Vigna angularis var. angularis]
MLSFSNSPLLGHLCIMTLLLSLSICNILQPKKKISLLQQVAAGCPQKKNSKTKVPYGGSWTSPWALLDMQPPALLLLTLPFYWMLHSSAHHPVLLYGFI